MGYQISPLLWRKVKGGLSAGRVQSVAVRIICERERQIQAFEPQEYWSITAHLKGDSPPPFEAKLTKLNKHKIKIKNEAQASAILEALKKTPFRVESISNKTKKRNPLPPFITSKLQQESIRKLRFSAKKTMMLAQQLYEGIELEGGEPVGLITYMRTDSTRISNEAAEEALAFIRETYGAAYSMGKPRFFKNRKKGSGRARGHQTDRCFQHTGYLESLPFQGSICPLSSYLESLCCLPDDTGAHRHPVHRYQSR